MLVLVKLTSDGFWSTGSSVWRFLFHHIFVMLGLRRILEPGLCVSAGQTGSSVWRFLFHHISVMLFLFCYVMLGLRTVRTED